MFLAIVIFAVLIGIGILMLLGMLPNGVDVIKFVTPQHSGIYFPDVSHVLFFIVLVVIGLVIAYFVYEHTHSQAYIVAQYNKRSKAIYDQYMATMQARLKHVLHQYNIDV